MLKKSMDNYTSLKILSQGASTSALFTFGPDDSLLWGISCACWMFSGIPGPYPLAASNSFPATTPSCPAENHCASHSVGVGTVNVPFAALVSPKPNSSEFSGHNPVFLLRSDSEHKSLSQRQSHLPQNEALIATDFLKSLWRFCFKYLWSLWNGPREGGILLNL